MTEPCDLAACDAYNLTLKKDLSPADVKAIVALDEEGAFARATEIERELAAGKPPIAAALSPLFASRRLNSSFLSSAQFRPRSLEALLAATSPGIGKIAVQRELDVLHFRIDGVMERLDRIASSRDLLERAVELG